MERDRAFATRVLESANKNDKQGLAELLKGEAPGSQITIREIRDFALDIFLTSGGKTYRLCISDKCVCKHPSGKTGCVVFDEF